MTNLSHFRERRDRSDCYVETAGTEKGEQHEQGNRQAGSHETQELE